MTVYAITDTKKGEQGLRLLIFKLPQNGYYHHTFFNIRQRAQSFWFSQY